MKLRNVVLACLIILPAFSYSFAQDKANSVLVDEFGAEIYERLRGRMDKFLMEILNNPRSKGSIVIYGDEKFPLAKYSQEIEIEKHLELRNFDMSRIIFLHGKDESNIRTELWFMPDGAESPLFSEGEWNYKLPANLKPFIIHRNSSVVEEGFETFSLKFYSKILKANPKIYGHLVIYEKSVKAYNLMINKLRKSLTEEYSVQEKQLKFFFSKNNISDVEFWIAPRN